ncbi:MAG: hypothetical protein H5T91_00980 [Synergistetes bacterium]|nr:MAG: hypothetical protein XD52_0780 [bacterium 42_11]MBC7330991.1 hypothetical protein [Synergistota bacterium]MDK2871618.1 hypothetical protein [bacterium]
MALRSFEKIPLPFAFKLSLFIGFLGGFFVFIVSLLSPVSLMGAVMRGFFASLIVSLEAAFLLYLFSRYGLDYFLFGKKVRMDLRSLASIKDFAWVYKTTRESEEHAEEKELPSLEKLLQKPSEFEEAVGELSELAKKDPEMFAKALKLMLEEG